MAYYYINGHFNTGDEWGDRTTAAELADDLDRIGNDGNEAAGPWETITDAETDEVYARKAYNDDPTADRIFDIEYADTCPAELRKALEAIYTD